MFAADQKQDFSGADKLRSIGFRTDGVGTCAGLLTRCVPQWTIQMNVGGVFEPSRSQKLNFGVNRIARRFQVHPNLTLNGADRSRDNETLVAWGLSPEGQ